MVELDDEGPNTPLRPFLFSSFKTAFKAAPGTGGSGLAGSPHSRAPQHQYPRHGHRRGRAAAQHGSLAHRDSPLASAPAPRPGRSGGFSSPLPALLSPRHMSSQLSIDYGGSTTDDFDDDCEEEPSEEEDVLAGSSASRHTRPSASPDCVRVSQCAETPGATQQLAGEGNADLSRLSEHTDTKLFISPAVYRAGLGSPFSPAAPKHAAPAVAGAAAIATAAAVRHSKPQLSSRSLFEPPKRIRAAEAQQPNRAAFEDLSSPVARGGGTHLVPLSQPVGRHEARISQQAAGLSGWDSFGKARGRPLDNANTFDALPKLSPRQVAGPAPDADAESFFMDGVRGVSQAAAVESSEDRSSYYRRQFEELSQLGSGSYALVYLCRHRIDGLLYAVKKSKRRLHGRRREQELLREVYALAKLTALGAPHVVRYHNAWVEHERLYIQTQYCPLLDVGLATQLLTISETRAMCRDILQALAFMHERGIAHLDVKPENIYRESAGCFLLGDLGLATRSADFGEEDLQIEGDGRYLSVEMLRREERLGRGGRPLDLKAADMFSFGLSVLEIASRSRLPASGEAWHELRNGASAAIAEARLHDEALVQLLTGLLKADPPERITAGQALQLL